MYLARYKAVIISFVVFSTAAGVFVFAVKPRMHVFHGEPMDVLLLWGHAITCAWAGGGGQA